MVEFIFKLRRNITMDGDLQLAQLELEAFLGQVKNIQTLESSHFESMSHYVRDRQQGYSAQGYIELLSLLIRRLTFIQRIYLVTDNTPHNRSIADHESAVTAYRVDAEELYIEAIPHYALFEFAEVIARQAKSSQQVRQELPILLDGLLARRDDKKAQSLIQKVMSAQIMTAPLSHGIHYYKAKFFPRMARSMLNISIGTRELSHLMVLDPFVGSGTTLLEASQLGAKNIGVDLDPLSVLISQMKIRILQSEVQLIRGAYSEINHRISTGQQSKVELSEIVFPDWLMKNRKMTSTIASELIDEINALRQWIWQMDDSVRDIAKVILSDAITRRIRFRFLGTGVGRFSLTFSKTPLNTLFLRALRIQSHNRVAWDWLRHTLSLQLADSHVQLGDARQLQDIEQVDLIVTSPPYLPASSGRESYAKARMPSLLALEIINQDGVNRLVDEAVGSMDVGKQIYEPTKQVTNLVSWLENDTLRQPKAQPTARYFADMRQTFVQMKQNLVSGGQIVLVSGRQSSFYRSSTREILYCVPVAEMLAQEAELAGLIVDSLVHIPLKKANRNARPRSLDDYDETLIFLSKP